MPAPRRLLVVAVPAVAVGAASLVAYLTRPGDDDRPRVAVELPVRGGGTVTAPLPVDGGLVSGDPFAAGALPLITARLADAAGTTDRLQAVTVSSRAVGLTVVAPTGGVTAYVWQNGAVLGPVSATRPGVGVATRRAAFALTDADLGAVRRLRAAAATRDAEYVLFRNPRAGYRLEWWAAGPGGVRRVAVVRP